MQRFCGTMTQVGFLAWKNRNCFIILFGTTLPLCSAEQDVHLHTSNDRRPPRMLYVMLCVTGYRLQPIVCSLICMSTCLCNYSSCLKTKRIFQEIHMFIYLSSHLLQILYQWCMNQKVSRPTQPYRWYSSVFWPLRVNIVHAFGPHVKITVTS